MTLAVCDIQVATRRVTRELPEAHWVTRRFRRWRFRAAAVTLRDTVFVIDPIKLSDGEYDEVIRFVTQGIKTLEVHTLATNDDVDFLRPILKDLRIALDGLECGLPADPAKRPTREEMAKRAGERALAGLMKRVS